MKALLMVLVASTLGLGHALAQVDPQALAEATSVTISGGQASSVFDGLDSAFGGGCPGNDCTIKFNTVMCMTVPMIGAQCGGYKVSTDQIVNTMGGEALDLYK